MDTFSVMSRPAVSGMVRHVQDVRVGSERHRLTFEGASDGPVLLWLDAGLGYSELGSLRARNRVLFEHFLVVHDGRLPEADATRDGARLGDLVADACSVIDVVRGATGGSRIVLAGHSIGAALALLAAAERQGALSAYVGVNQPVGPAPDALLRLRLVLAQAAARGAASAAQSVVAAGQATPSRHEAGDLAAFAENVRVLHRLTRDPADLVWWAAANEAGLDLDEVAAGSVEGAAARTWDSLADFDALAHVPPLDIPTFFVAGRHDPVVPLAAVERFVDAVRMPGRVRLVVMEDSGHFAYWEQADAFNEFLLDEVLAAADADPSRQPREPDGDAGTRASLGSVDEARELVLA